MIIRDNNNLIVQHNADHPEYRDGGDTASRTGLMAMCGSIDDIQNLEKLIVMIGVDNYKLVRHPKQKSNGHPAESKDFRDWTDPQETSRDQVICFAAGLKYGYQGSIVFRALHNYAKSCIINKDILLPHYKLTLYRAIGSQGSLISIVFGYPMLLLHLLFSAYLKPNAEQNQTIAMLAHYPDWLLRIYCKAHGNIAENMFKYWAGKPWRDQFEIGLAICEHIDQRTGLCESLVYKACRYDSVIW